MLLRPATTADVAALTALYNERGVATTASYDLEPVTVEARTTWLTEHTANHWPVLVAQVGRDVIGFAAYGPFRSKGAYDATVESSVYVDARHQGQGVGRDLMRALIEVATRQNIHAMVAVIDAANSSSITFHERLGFHLAGTLPQVGRKFGRWLDTSFLVLLLGDVPTPESKE